MKMRRVVLLSTIWLFFLPALEKENSIFPHPASLYLAVQQHPSLLDHHFQLFADRYEQWLSNQLTEEGVPGAAMAIVKKGVTAKISTHGQRDLISGKAVDKHTVFRVASLSKGFTGLLAATMTQDSLIEWNTPLCKWLPAIQFKTCDYSERLQLQHLLTHTTGLPRHTYSNLLNMGRSYQNILSLLPLVEPAHPVGTYHSYQNVMFNLAGDMLAAAAGTSFEQLIAQKLLQPVGMSNTSVTFEAMQAHPNRALPCRRAAAGYAPAQLEPDYYAVPAAAGVNASIYDMAKYLKLAMGYHPEVADSTALQQAYQARIPIPAANYMLREWRPLKAAHYGMGWRIVKKETYTVITHSGYVNGYRAEIAFCPQEEIGIVILSNAPNSTVGQAVPAFFRRYFQHYLNGQPTT
ncbi:MAG: serine hydrolase [Bacteroidetes bacterium]|jgi:beta-lactamase class C|nr:serine hydrolase [Bacteroidota bacterium]